LYSAVKSEDTEALAICCTFSPFAVETTEQRCMSAIYDLGRCLSPASDDSYNVL